MLDQTLQLHRYGLKQCHKKIVLTMGLKQVMAYLRQAIMWSL